MRKSHVFNASAHPAQRLGGGWRTSFSMLDPAPRHQFASQTPEMLMEQITEWARNLPTREGAVPGGVQTSWSVLVEPAAGRWPAGFKAHFTRGMLVDITVPAVTS